MDRIGRNLDDLGKLVLSLTERGVRVQFIKENLIFTGEDSPMANLLLSVMGAFVQFERELIREHQREGIALAKAAGAYRGRKRVMSAERAEELVRRLSLGESKAALARDFGIDRATVYRYLERTRVSLAADSEESRDGSIINADLASLNGKWDPGVVYCRLPGETHRHSILRGCALLLESWLGRSRH